MRNPRPTLLRTLTRSSSETTALALAGTIRGIHFCFSRQFPAVMVREPSGRSRRQLLASLAAGGLGGLAGCVITGCACSAPRPHDDRLRPYVTDISVGDGRYSGTVTVFNPDSVDWRIGHSLRPAGVTTYRSVGIHLLDTSGETSVVVDVGDVAPGERVDAAFDAESFPQAVAAVADDHEVDDDTPVEAGSYVSGYVGRYEEPFEPPPEYDLAVDGDRPVSSVGDVWYPVWRAEREDDLTSPAVLRTTRCFQRRIRQTTASDALSLVPESEQWTDPFQEGTLRVYGDYRNLPGDRYRTPATVPDDVQEAYDPQSGDEQTERSVRERELDERAFDRTVAALEGDDVARPPPCDAEGRFCSWSGRIQRCGGGRSELRYRADLGDEEIDQGIVVRWQWEGVEPDDRA